MVGVRILANVAYSRGWAGENQKARRSENPGCKEIAETHMLELRKTTNKCKQ